MDFPIVLIHGAFCGAWAFDGYAQLFAAHGAKVHAPTLRHHDVLAGRRAPSELGTTSMLDYAADIEVLVNSFKTPPVLIGHSMGGLVAQMVAQRTKVRALALVAPSAPWGTLPTSPWEIMSAQGLYFAGQFWNKPLQPEAWVAETHALDLIPPGQREAIFARFVPESGLATFEIMHWGMDIRRATFVDARKIDCPVLCVAGALDRVNPARTVASIARRYRNRGEYFEVEKASHWLIGEPGWERTALYIREWIGNVTSPVPA
ncbi:MAG: alpha/beta hydrolase [Micropepsaceae bacterium]